MDPLNEFATHRLIQRFHSIMPGTDLEWFNHFSNKLLTRTLSSNKRYPTPKLYSRSSTFVAFDLEESSMTLKAYFIPTLRAAMTQQTRLALVADAIESLPPAHFASLRQSSSLVFGYMKLFEQRLQLELEILAIDCVDPAQSRLKVYFRSQSTTFESVREIMTLGGKIGGRDSKRALDDLESLWRMLLWPDKRYSPFKQLRQNPHRTAGVLYYFEIRPGHAEPTGKVYIPVRHYGRNDEDIARGLQTFLTSRRPNSEIENYMQALKTGS